LRSRATLLDEQNLSARVPMPRRASTGFEPATRHAPAFGLERAAGTDEALGIRGRVLRVSELEERDAAERGNAEKVEP